MVEPGAPRFARGIERPAGRVHPVQHRQHVRGRRLHAQRHPREPGRAQPLEQLRRRRLRVGLGGDLGVRGQREVRADRVEHRRQPVAAQQRRGAAADEHGVAPSGGVPSRARRGRARCAAPPASPSGVRAAQLGGGVGVEVAVAAARRTERHVDIDAERPAWRARPCRAARRTPSRTVMQPVSQSGRFAHRERKFRPVRAGVGYPWHNWRS